MYICLECGCLFTVPAETIERHGLDSPPYEVIKGCPNCGGGYVEAKVCDLCGEYIADEHVEIEDGHTYCDNCYVLKNIEDLY